VIVVGVTVTGLACSGDVEVTWSFSAFTVLVYYALTNFAALRLPEKDRLYPRFFAWCGLLACGFLAFWVAWPVWVAGLALVGVGLVWHAVARRLASVA
jgi:APA family basic amino acid/polyamine antiporter